jgi:hypothetical protein
MKVKNDIIDIINYGIPLTDSEKDILLRNYKANEIIEINFKCKGWSISKKPIYLQCVDWISLIPEKIINNKSFVLKLPDTLPKEVSIYMIIETYSRSGKLPKIIEYKDGKLNRIVDLDYENNFSKSKRSEDIDANYNSENYNKVNKNNYNYNENVNYNYS